MKIYVGYLFSAFMLLCAAQDSEALLFSLNHADLPGEGQIVQTWGEFHRGTGAPVTTLINGVKWLHNPVIHNHPDLPNQYPMMRHNGGAFMDPIPINGATIVAAVKPLRHEYGGVWTSVVDVFYDQLCIGISNQTGLVRVKVSDSRGTNHTWTAPAGTAIPDGEAGVLSMTVTNTGAFTVYWKGEDGVERLVGTGQGAVESTYTQLTPGSRDRGFARYINIGRNNPDPWPVFNGYIGDTYVYGRVLSQAERTTLVGNTWNAMGIRPDTGEPPGPGRVIINEFMASNRATITDEDGDFEDWIELYNYGDGPVNLSGWGLSDRLDKPFMWRFPEGTVLDRNMYLLVFASGKDRTHAASPLHTNFRISVEGEPLLLTDPEGTLIDHVPPTEVPRDFSYGRKRDHTDQWTLFSQPTPGSENSGPDGHLLTETVHFSLPSQTFSNSITISLSGHSSSQEIRLTWDGTQPHGESELYTGPFELTSTRVIRARIFDVHGAPSLPVTRQYIRLHPDLAGFRSHLPMVVLDARGQQLSQTITVEGSLRYDGYFMLFDRDQAGISDLSAPPTLATRQGVRWRGSSSLNEPKKPYSVELWDEFDEDAAHSVLGMHPDSDWVFYTGYHWDRAYIRNAVAYELSRRAGRWASETRFVEVFVNHDGADLTSDDYAGVYNIIERIKQGEGRLGHDNVTRRDIPPVGPIDVNASGEWTGNYIFKVDRVRADEYDLLPRRSYPGVGAGYVMLTRPKLYQLDGGPYSSRSAAKTKSRQLAYISAYLGAFKQALFSDRDGGFQSRTYTNYIDRASWTDYLVLNAFMMNVDAQRFSTYFHKPENDRIFSGPLWDFDRSMGSNDGRSQPWAQWHHSTSDTSRYFEFDWWGVLCEDPDFVQAFYDRWAAWREDIFQDAALIALVETMGAEINQSSPDISSAAVRNVQKWTDVPHRGGDYWNEITHLQNWLINRANWMDRRRIDGGLLPKPPALQPDRFGVVLTSNNGETIYYTLDGSDPRAPDGATAGQAYEQAVYVNQPTRLTARALSDDGHWSTPLIATLDNGATSTFGLVELIAGGDPKSIDLALAFDDKDAVDVEYTASTDHPHLLDLLMEGSTLWLYPLARGGAEIVVTRTRTGEPDLLQSFRALIYPDAHVLADGIYTFAAWSADEPDGSYPPHMLFLQSDQNDTVLDTPLEYAYHIEHGDYHANDAGTIGYPYNNTSRTRINGLGDNGIAFINTGRSRDLGGALLALDTRGVDTAPVGWLGGTLLPNTRIYAIRLQYRVGTTGPFTDIVDGDGWPVEYVRHEVAGHVQNMEPVSLPAAALNQAYVQLLWRYYLVEGISGARAQLRLDEVLVANHEPGAATHLVFDAPPPYWQSGQPLPPISVRAISADGFTDPSFSGTVSLGIEGGGTLSGTTSVQSQAGVATFHDLAITGTGAFTLTAQGGSLAPALSGEIRLASVTGLVVPRFMQGGQDGLGENNDRVPFAFRARIDGLSPHTTYRAGNRVVTAGDPWDQNGAGNSILITGAGSDWVRNTNAPRFLEGDLNTRHVAITTDGSGSWSGWFITEPTGNARFTPGGTVYLRLLLNDGAGGETTQHILTLPEEVTVIRFGEAPHEATAVMGHSAVPARHLVMLYDNTAGEGRPLAATPVEITGSEVDARYAAFYAQVVATTPHYWGALIPNALPSGVRRVESRSLTGTLFPSQTFAEGAEGTVNPSAGLDAILLGAAAGEPVFLPGGDADWTEHANWSSTLYPDGISTAARINEPVSDNRTVTLRAPVTIGHLTIDNAESTFRNRIDAADAGHTLRFASVDGPARLTIEGSGSGFVEFNIHAGVVLESNLLISVANLNLAHGREGADVGDDYGALRLRESWSGAGGVSLEGPGVMTLTGADKLYSGPTVVHSGVLRVTEPAAPVNTDSVTVHPGGQLRLVSGGSVKRVYTFGGPLSLSGMGRGEEVPGGEELGILGALRYDAGSNDNTAEVTNAITLQSDASLHVDGTRNELILSGPLSGVGALSKSGGGTLTLSGESPGYSAPVVVSTGVLRIESAIASDATLHAGTVLTGSGTLGAISGTGTVSPEGGTLSAESVNGLRYRLTFSEIDPGLLRLRGGAPFGGVLNAASSVAVYLDTQALRDGDVFTGGFFTDAPTDFAAWVSNATWSVYLRDAFGDTEHQGQSYSAYSGTLGMTRETVAASLDFGDGPVEGRMLRLRFSREEPTGFAAWQQREFTSVELEDPQISGPLADPEESGIPNLLRYALGLARYDAHDGALPHASVHEEGPVYEHRRLLDPDRDVSYEIQVAEDLIAGDWRAARMGEDLIPLTREPSGDGLTEILRYHVPLDPGQTILYFRVMVTQ